MISTLGVIYRYLAAICVNVTIIGKKDGATLPHCTALAADGPFENTCN
jgi:hypothetical protein